MHVEVVDAQEWEVQIKLSQTECNVMYEYLTDYSCFIWLE